MPESDGTLRILIRGHSSVPTGNFTLPKKVTVNFLSKDGELCYAFPGDSIDLIKHMDHESYQLKYSGDGEIKIPNYTIICNMEKSEGTEGIFLLGIDGDKKDAEFMLGTSLIPGPEHAERFAFDFQELIKYLVETFQQYDKIELYGVFCRGKQEPTLEQYLHISFPIAKPFNNQYRAEQNFHKGANNLKMKNEDMQQVLKENATRNVRELGKRNRNTNTVENTMEIRLLPPHQKRRRLDVPSLSLTKSEGGNAKKKTTRKRRKTTRTKGKKRTNLSRKRRKTKNKRR